MTWKCLKCRRKENQLGYYNGRCDVFDFCWDCIDQIEINEGMIEARERKSLIQQEREYKAGCKEWCQKNNGNI